MRRTKQWWQALTKEERSELHHLEYAISDWMNQHREPFKSCSLLKCTHCGGPRGRNYNWVCEKCLNRRSELVKKADKIVRSMT